MISEPLVSTETPDIRELSPEKLKEWLTLNGEKPFRAVQIQEWLWQKNAPSFEAMSSLSKDLRRKLNDAFTLNKISVASKRASRDGSVKYGFQLADGNLIEGVLIPTDDRERVTACISSQVGCSLTCKFCATGYLKLKRNVFAYEIFEQVALLRQESETLFERPLSNIVYMGMGEPLLNYKNVWTSIEKITDPNGLGMAPKRITVSTAGIAKMIKKLGDDGARFEFALSLHAANDAKRNEIMPINESNSLEALKDALRYFYKKTGTRVTFEYIVFHNFNDELTDAQELLTFSRCVPCKINIIEYNPIEEATFQNAAPQKLDRFIAFLESKGLIVNVRRSRGRDVDGACGQLALKNVESPSIRNYSAGV